MSQFGSIQQIGQVAFNPAAAPVETYTVPLAGQPLAGNNLQQIAEALAPMSPALNRLAMAITEEGRQQAAMEGAGLDFSMTQLSKDIEANEKAFRDVIAQTGSPNAANPYFQIAARQAYGKAMARQYEGEVTAMLSQLQDPFNSPEYATATAELKKKYQDQLTSNLYQSSSFNLAAQEIDGRMARRVFEAKSQNMEKFRIEETGVEIGNEILALGQFGRNPESVDRIGQHLDDLRRVGVDGTESLIKGFNAVLSDPNITPEQIDEVLAEISEVRVGKAIVARNAALMGQLSNIAERTKNSLVSRGEREAKIRASRISDHITDNLVSKGFLAQLRKSPDPHSLIEPAVDGFRKSLGEGASDLLVEEMRDTLSGMADKELTRRSSLSQAARSFERNESETIRVKMERGEIPTNLTDSRLTPEDALTLALRKSNAEYVESLRKAAFAKPISSLAMQFDGVIERDFVGAEYAKFVESKINSLLPEISGMDQATALTKLGSYADSMFQEFSKSFQESNKQKMETAEQSRKATEELQVLITSVQRGETAWTPEVSRKASDLLSAVLASPQKTAMSGEIALSREYEAVTKVAGMADEIRTLSTTLFGSVADSRQMMELSAEWNAYFPLEQQRELVEESRGKSPAEREAFIINNVRDRFGAFARMKAGRQQVEAAQAEAVDYTAAVEAIVSAGTDDAKAQAVQAARTGFSQKIRKDMKALGISEDLVLNPSEFARRLKKGGPVVISSGVFTGDKTMSQEVAKKVYRSLADTYGYTPVSLKSATTGEFQDDRGIPFDAPPNPWKTSFALNDKHIQELEQMGFAAIQSIFPSAIKSEEDFKTWIDAQRTLMLLRAPLND